MTDAKTLIAAVAEGVQEAAAAIEAEQSALAAANQEIDFLQTQVASQASQILDLKAQIAALQPADPWAGVDKTGATDVTAAMQKALDAGLTVPAGRYLVDAVKGLIATHNATLDPNAVLVVKPNSAPRYVLLTLGDGVTLKGGQIIGDRLSHTYTAGSTHEWGYGLKLGNRCTVDGLKISQCTGDGICASGDGCTISNVVSTQNRRQGMSIFSVNGLLVEDSEFSFTGAMGNNPGAPNGPCAGVDIEPDSGNATGVVFNRCKLTDNQTAGLLLWTRSGTGSAISATANDCTFARDANGINAKSLSGQPVTLTVNGGLFDSNRSSAARIDTGATLTISNAKVIGTLQRYALQGTGTIKASGMTYA